MIKRMHGGFVFLILGSLLTVSPPLLAHEGHWDSLEGSAAHMESHFAELERVRFESNFNRLTELNALLHVAG